MADFAHYVEPGLEQMFEHKRHARNPGIAGNLLFIKRLLNCFLTEQESISVAMELNDIARLDESFVGKVPVPRHAVDRIIDGYSEDIEALNRQFGLTLEPRSEPITGPLCPDYERLQSDLGLIRDAAHARNMKLASLLDRLGSDFFSAIVTGAWQEAVKANSEI